MSATALVTRPAARRGLRLRGATWLSWRQNRFGLLVVAVLVVGAIALLLYDRHQLDVVQARMRALHCDPIVGQACIDADRASYDIRARWSDLALAILALPGLVGAMLGAQPLAADFERGRHLLLWSQSVSPRRWLTHRLAWPAAVLLVLSTVLSVTVRWTAYWSHPPQPALSEWSDAVGSHDLVPVYPVLTLAAFALGALVGLMLHRVIAALGVTLFLYGVLVYVVEQVRPYLLPLHHLVLRGPSRMPHGAWVQSLGVVLNGKDVPFSQCGDGGCGNVPTWILYHPASEFSPMLWIETGILAALTVVLVILTYRRLAALTR